jgi:hypothetical protein
MTESLYELLGVELSLPDLATAMVSSRSWLIVLRADLPEMHALPIPGHMLRRLRFDTVWPLRSL